jgi:hypothetical protein
MYKLRRGATDDAWWIELLLCLGQRVHCGHKRTSFSAARARSIQFTPSTSILNVLRRALMA